jgi:cullin 3
VGDILHVNDEFSSKLFRVKVPLISASSLSGATGASSGVAVLDEDGADISAYIENQRKTMVEASIVRIMKSRKSLDHGSLIAEVTRQLSSRFYPSPADIKKRIEDLIEREYLERDPVDKKLYSYTA